jgi:CBS domain-containing protein
LTDSKRMSTISVGELMTERLETIDSSRTAQEASKKMKDNKIGHW